MAGTGGRCVGASTTALTMILSTLQTGKWGQVLPPTLVHLPTSPKPTKLASSRAKLFSRHRTHIPPHLLDGETGLLS